MTSIATNKKNIPKAKNFEVECCGEKQRGAPKANMIAVNMSPSRLIFRECLICTE